MALVFSQMKDNIRNRFGSSALYQRAKASWIYDFYWTIADPRIVESRQAEVNFYRGILKGLQRGDLIFDIGANQGYKTDIFLRLGARVVAVDPDNFCVNTLKKKFLGYRLKNKPLSIVAKAVSERSSEGTMWIDAPGSALNTLSAKWADALRGDSQRFGHTLGFIHRASVETVAIDELVAVHGSPFFIKIDVEGHELSVLRGMKGAVPYLSFEVNLPDFRPEGLECVQTLARLAPSGTFNYTADCRRGLALSRWIGPKEFSALLGACTESSIEVFFRAFVPGAIAGRNSSHGTGHAKPEDGNDAIPGLAMTPADQIMDGGGSS